MQNQRKVIILISMVFIIELLIGVLIYNQFIKNQVKKFENPEIQQKSRQVVAAFWNSVSDMNVLMFDWTERISLGEIINDMSEDSMKSFFSPDICLEYNIDFLFILGKDYSTLYLLEAENPINTITEVTYQRNKSAVLKNDLSQQSINRVKNTFIHIIEKSDGDIQDILVIDNQVYYLYSQPLISRTDKQETAGYLAIVRKINDSVKEQLTMLLQEQNISIHPFSRLVSRGELEKADIQKTTISRKSSSDGVVDIYSLIPSKSLKQALAIKLTHSTVFLRRLRWLPPVFIILITGSFVLIISIILLMFRKNQENMKLLIKISKNLSNKMAGKTHHSNRGDPSDELYEILNNLFMNIGIMEKEKEKSMMIEKTREKLMAVGRIAAELSHEINTPIRIIKNCLPPIEKKMIEKGMTEKDLKMFSLIKKEVRMLDSITDNLLTYFKIESNNAVVIQIGELIENTITRFKSTLERDITVNYQPEENPQVFITPYKFEQVVLNLLKNARDADADTIDITCQVIDSYCIFKLSDNGKGIDPDLEQRIFEPFFTTKKKRSLGLGLNISYNIIMQHGGEMFLEDKESRGTCFVIKLPAIEEY